MAIVPPSLAPLPTNVAPLPRLLAYAQALGLARHLHRPKRGLPTLALALLWLVLAWRGSGRPRHLEGLDEPLLATLLGGRLPCPRTLRRSLAYFAAHDVRAAVEAAYLAALPRRTGRVWAAIDAHQLPYWGRGKLDRFQKGWAGAQGRPLRGYRLYLAVDTDTGQVITYLRARGGRRDHQVLAVLTRRARALLGRRLAGVLADCGFTSRASVAAMAATGVPFILGFARSAPIRRRLAALSGQQRRALRAGGAIRLGACPWDDRLRLFALGARTPGDRRGPWVYVTSLRSAGPQWLAAAFARRLRALLGHRLAGVVADCGFTSRASVAALAGTGVPFILGFARSKPLRERLAALSGQQRRWLRAGGAVRLGACPWDDRLRLFALGARSPTDKRGPWVYVTSLRSAGPQRLAATYRQRWRVEQAIEELLNGADLDHLVGYRLHPNRVAIGFRLLARNLAIGLQIKDADGRPAQIREPAAFRAAHVDGLATFALDGPTILLCHPGPDPEATYPLPRTGRTVRLVA